MSPPKPPAAGSGASRRILLLAIIVMMFAVGMVLSSFRARRFDSIRIRGTKSFQERVAEALTLLKTRSPEAYAIVTNNIGAITESKRSGMAAWQTPPTFELADPSAFYSLTWCAIAISHDSFHSKMYHDYLRQHPGQPVPDGVWTGEEAEKKCCEHEYRVAIQIGASSDEIAHSRWDANDPYWKVPYDKVNW